MTIYFYTPNKPFGEFSNFARFGVEIDGQWWQTVEHYFQAQKFTDPALIERIRLAATPKLAATLGRSREVPIRQDWESVKEQIMRRAVLAKFRTHAALRKRLLSTGGEPIVENAPGDYFWGCGKDGSGLNRLGAILESVRNELQDGP